MSASPQQVVAAARALLGTPWMHQARLPGQAVDCVGLVVLVARQLGLVPAEWDVQGYSRMPDGSLLQLCAQHMQPIEALEEGAVIAVRTLRDPQHLAIVAGSPGPGRWRVVHACQRAGRVVETRLLLRPSFGLCGVYRLPGVRV
jgi:cell wall-associated NlpC family hydrolase